LLMFSWTGPTVQRTMSCIVIHGFGTQVYLNLGFFDIINF